MNKLLSDLYLVITCVLCSRVSLMLQLLGLLTCCLSYNKESLFHNQTLKIHQVGVGGRAFQQTSNTCDVPQPAAFVSGMCLKNGMSVSSLGSAQIQLSGEEHRVRATI